MANKVFLEDCSTEFVLGILEKELEKRIKTEYFWTTKQGKQIKVEDMSTNHIQNCIKKLKEKQFLEENLDYPDD